MPQKLLFVQRGEVPANNEETKLKGRQLHWVVVQVRTSQGSSLQASKESKHISVVPLPCCFYFFWSVVFFFFLVSVPWIWRMKRLKKKVKFKKSLSSSRSAVKLGEGIHGFKAAIQYWFFLCHWVCLKLLEGSLKSARYSKSGQCICVGQVTWNCRFWCLLNKQDIVFPDD